MESIQVYIILFIIIVIVGQLFQKTPIPIGLILVITGMILSFIPGFPVISLNPEVVLNVFLPLLIYQISAFSSWRDVKSNLRPIALLSIGHVLFITLLIAVLVHLLIPEMGWALAFLIGAVISPPDDVAIVSIAEKIRMPERVLVILEGEGMFNDATALILFRFALAAVITHQFSALQSAATYLAVIVGETLYGLGLGYVIGKLRSKITNPMLHIIASILTPFLAYIPATQLGGSGILATAITGFIIGNHFVLKFTPEFRLISRTIWPALFFGIQNFIFLTVGLRIRLILERISTISPSSLLLYSSTIILAVILGRFFWNYVVVAFLPRILLPSIRKKDPLPPWQYLFIISWAGMRGGISLAAAVAVPVLPLFIEGANVRDVIIFLVFCVIVATLIIQGLSLPWILKALGIQKQGLKEQYCAHLTELNARIEMAKAVLRWLTKYKVEVQDNLALLNEVNLQLKFYRRLLRQLKESIEHHDKKYFLHDEKLESQEERFLSAKINEIERSELLKLWYEEKIKLSVRNKLLDRLDHQAQYLPGNS